MPAFLIATRRAPSPWRRVFTAALLALQVVIAFSPLAERPVSGSAVAHAHDQQRRHPASHDESTCVVCAVRTQVAVTSAPSTAVVEVVRVSEPTPAALVGAPAQAKRGVPPSRAPPVLG